MEISELTLWVARFAVLALMYLFLLTLVLILRTDIRAAATPRKATEPPVPASRPPREAPASSLTVVSGTVPITGHEYRLFAPLDVGREPACGISIPNRFVSKRHARIYREGNDWVVEDLGSTNGSQINGKPLTTPHVLTPGDRLIFGDTEFEVG